MTIEGDDEPVLLAVSHGTSSDTGRRAVSALVDAVRAAGEGIDVRAGFVDVQRPDLPMLLARLGGRRAVVVPLLLSAGYHVHVDIAEAVESTQGRAVVAGALGPDPRLIEVLRARVEASGAGIDDTVVLAAAGSSDEGAVADCRLVSRMLSTALGRDVEVGFLSAARPRLSNLVETVRGRLARGGRVVVSSYLLAPGYFQNLVEECGADVVTPPLLDADEPPPAALVDVVLARYAAAIA